MQKSYEQNKKSPIGLSGIENLYKIRRLRNFTISAKKDFLFNLMAYPEERRQRFFEYIQNQEIGERDSLNILEAIAINFFSTNKSTLIEQLSVNLFPPWSNS